MVFNGSALPVSHNSKRPPAPAAPCPRSEWILRSICALLIGFRLLYTVLGVIR